MKIRAFVVSALLLCGMSATVRVVEANRPAYGPQAVSEAIQARDTPRLIRSLITEMKERLEKDDETFPELIREVRNYADECPDTAATALLHSMAAEMYQSYYNRNRWKINRRTDLSGYVPEDIREWTANLFDSRIREELDRSLEPAKLLQETPIGRYKAILTDEESHNLRPTLYDFLMGRAMEIAPDTARYREWEAFRKGEDNTEAWLQVRLAQLQYLQERQFITPEQRYEELTELSATYASQPFANEIRSARVEHLANLRWSRPQQQQDSIVRTILQLCEEGIRQQPDSPATARLRNMRNELTGPYIHTTYPNQLYPGREAKLSIRYRNTPQLTVRLYKSLRKPEEAWNHLDEKGKKRRGAQVKEFTLSGNLPDNYTERDSTFVLPFDLPSGLYECVVSVPGKQLSNSHCISVSRLATIYRNLDNGEKEVLVTDSESGEPQANATVYYYRRQRGNVVATPAGHVQTNASGLATLPKLRDLECLRPVSGTDTAAVWTPVYGGYLHRPDNNSRMELSLFTDRGLYRPGQTVFVKGIAYVKDQESPQVVANRQIDLSLRNANGQEVGKKSFTTDRFGAFNGEFALPNEGLGGTYRLTSSAGDGCTFRVEEYKRPTFRLEIEPLTTEAAFGQALHLNGKAATYSGVNLTEGKVNWRIVRRPFWLRYYMPNPFDHTTRQVAEGETTVDAQGRFSIAFTPAAEDSDPSREREERYIAQNYELTATLTDSKGETQETTYTFAVSNVGLILQIQMPSQMEASKAHATFKATTINSHPVDVTGDYTIHALSEGQSRTTDYRGEEEYAVTATVSQGTFDTREPLEANCFDTLPSGRYRLEIKAKDGKGREVSTRQTFVLYRNEDKRPPVFSDTWMIEEKSECLPGEEAHFTFGTSHQQAYLLYELYSSDAKRIHREWIRLSNENRRFTVPFQPLYGNGLTASFTFVKEGKLHTRSLQIRRQQPDRKLQIVPTTFRDHLLPGSRESWKFRIMDSDSANITAQVLAGMYDASLDRLQAFQWYFHPERAITFSLPVFREGSSFQTQTEYDAEPFKHEPVQAAAFQQLDWQGVLNRVSGFGAYKNRLAAGNSLMKSAAIAPVVEELSITDDAVMLDSAMAENTVASGEPEAENPKQPSFKPRTDFAETAFFYPALETDDSGEVAFSFTLPESNTTWKLQLLAQTEDLKYGYLSKEVLTSKPLMVLPNLPRFMRQGDRVTISTQVINQSEQTINGRVRLELFDPTNDQPVACLSKAQKPFTLEARSQTSVQWTLPVPDNRQPVGCRIVAESDEGSDGEQHLIPILSNQLLLTESRPFYLLDEGEQQISLPVHKGGQPFRYTLEVSTNPIWYAVQALPTLSEPENDNILSWFASYYSNTLASHIAQAHPRIQTIIQQWTAQGGNASTLLSALEKNTELKNILLEETPWVWEAKDETEQKQRLALLFNLNRAAGQREAALRHLLQEQNADGSWSWFKGFGGNRLITLSILKGMAQLTELNAIQYSQKEKEMQIKALNFLDESIRKDYEQLKQHNRHWQKAMPSYQQVDYLFVRSLYRDIPELGSAREAIRFYTDQAARYWSDMSLHSKGETALLMYRNGRREVTEKIAAWLRKTATTSNEKGMYWANNRRDNNYFTSPIETHCLLMSLFQKLTSDPKETDRMKQWLLNQKQTQNWESEPATVHAIYALLLTGSDWLDENNACAIQWGNRSYNTAEGESATGYLKATIHQQEIVPEMQTAAIRKTGQAPAWGAVYTQYFQDINQVGRQKGQLDVEKRLFVESNSGSGLQITPVAEGQHLQVGDKVIVRLVIRTDRDMDYVVLKDLRAGCFEPADPLSGNELKDGLRYYRSPKDVSENFFFDHLPKGTFVLEYAAYVTRPGEYAGGISTIQCLYAPEFVSHTEGVRITVQ